MVSETRGVVSKGVSVVGATSGAEVSGVSSSGVAGSARWTPVIALGTFEVDLISMMVLLVKQVHLQKVGAAVVNSFDQYRVRRGKHASPKRNGLDLHAAAMREAHAPSRRRRRSRRCIVGKSTS